MGHPRAKRRVLKAPRRLCLINESPLGNALNQIRARGGVNASAKLIDSSRGVATPRRSPSFRGISRAIRMRVLLDLEGSRSKLPSILPVFSSSLSFCFPFCHALLLTLF